MSEFTKERISQLVGEYIKKTLEDDEKCRALGNHTMGEGLYVTGGSNMGQKEAESLCYLSQTVAKRPRPLLVTSGGKQTAGQAWH